jgi:hypothetical protein
VSLTRSRTYCPDPGDFNRDGHPDLTAVQTSTGYVFLYPGNGTTLQARIRIATGFTGRTPMA